MSLRRISRRTRTRAQSAPDDKAPGAHYRSAPYRSTFSDDTCKKKACPRPIGTQGSQTDAMAGRPHRGRCPHTKNGRGRATHPVQYVRSAAAGSFPCLLKGWRSGFDKHVLPASPAASPEGALRAKAHTSHNTVAAGEPPTMALPLCASIGSSFRHARCDCVLLSPCARGLARGFGEQAKTPSRMRIDSSTSLDLSAWRLSAGQP